MSINGCLIATLALFITFSDAWAAGGEVADSTSIPDRDPKMEEALSEELDRAGTTGTGQVSEDSAPAQGEAGESPLKSSQVESTSVDSISAESDPVELSTVESDSVESGPGEPSRVDSSADESSSGDSGPVESKTGEPASVESDLVESGPVDSVSAELSPAEQATDTMDLDALKYSLRKSKAIGLFTKLELKSQVDELMDDFDHYHRQDSGLSIDQLKDRFGLLLMKLLVLLQDGDPALHANIVNSRAALWETLADPFQFAAIRGA